MKTNSVKKVSEKNIEMFQMSNEELETINGGLAYQVVIGPDGKPILVIYNPITASIQRFFARFNF